MSKNNDARMNGKSEKDAPEVRMDDSDEVDVMDSVPEADDEEGSPEVELQAEMNQIDTLCRQLAEEKEKVEKEKKEYLFLMAEFDNYRKRTVKEKGDIIRNAAESAMKGLLPIVDDFERGIEANKNATDVEAVKEGMELIYNKLLKYLEQNGVKPADTTGKPFDPDTQEAIAMVPATDEAQKGMVIDTPTKGYTINDKVLRHAKVVVGQ
ncbi:MAG: nucleotide exchange factor GrpE [Muribaculaceae bacterium]|nr:nucleotide exchange factor GrpE [Muribaculaceae bacterium]